MKEVQDSAAHLEHLQFILLEFDTNNAPGEGQLGRTFYDGLRPSIKLWIADIREDMPWDDLIRTANKAEAILGMPFLFLSNVDVKFAELGKLTWRSYTAAEALPTTSRLELIDKREFAKAAMDKNSETFVVHMSALDVAESSIHPSRAAQIAALQ